jgi:quercetin dioxygenase-like cupin family protein
MRWASFVTAFLLGACTTAAIQSTARSPVEGDAAEHDSTSPPYVVRLDDAERRAAPSGTASVSLLARGDNAFLGKLEMQPGAAVPEHRDATEEYIHVLSGGGIMHIEEQRLEIRAGDTIYMPANALVRFENGDEPMVALQVFAGPEPADKYDAWTQLR